MYRRKDIYTLPTSLAYPANRRGVSLHKSVTGAGGVFSVLVLAMKEKIDILYSNEISVFFSEDL
jgi:hypothetical protein